MSAHECARDMLQPQGEYHFSPMECIECKTRRKKKKEHGKRVPDKKPLEKSKLSRVHSVSPRDGGGDDDNPIVKRLVSREEAEIHYLRWWWHSDEPELLSDLIVMSPLQRSKRYRSRSVPHDCAKILYNTVEFPQILEKTCADYVTAADEAGVSSQRGGDTHCARLAPPRQRRRRTTA